MPSGGDGFYYFSIFLTAWGAEYSYFDVEFSGELLCTASSDMEDTSSVDYGVISCSGVTYAVEGIVFDV